MTQKNQVNEASIKIALTQGYITSKEAKHMLRVYLHKLNPSPSPHSNIKSQCTDPR